MRFPCHPSLLHAVPRVRASARLLGAVALAGWLVASAAPGVAQTVVLLDEPAAVPPPAALSDEAAPIRLGAAIPPSAPAAVPPAAASAEPPVPASVRLGAAIPDELRAVVAPPAPVRDQVQSAPTPRRAPDLGAGLPAAPTPVPPSPTTPPTEAPRPATLTPTPVPPTATPVVSIIVGPTAAPVVVLPADAPPLEAEAEAPPASAASESPGAPAARTSSRDSAAAPARPATNALPFQPRTAPTRSYVAGLPDEPGAAGWLDDSLLWLGVPSRTQYDGTAYQSANCGPSALGMILEAYGLKMATSELRAYANYLQGSYGYDDGIALDHLAEIGRRANLKPIGLYGERGYRRWTVDDVRASVSRGYPVIALTVYRLLPWSGGYGGNINHYVVISGLSGDDFLYNDSAFGGKGGRGLVITADELETAWARADIPRHALAFGSGDQGHGLLGMDPTRLGRGAGDGRLLASNASIDPRPRAAASTTFDSPLFRLGPGAALDGALPEPPAAVVAPPPDPAIVARDSLLNGGAGLAGPASLLGAPLVGGTTTASFVPGAVLPPDPAQPLDAMLDDPAPPEGGLVGFLRVGIILGGVGGLYLLLLAQTALARLGRRSPDSSGG
jgi:hypothetical protein